MTRTGKFILYFFGVCAASVALAIVAFTIWRVNLAHDVSQQIAAIHAAGLPASGAEADDYYTAVPENENAAVKMARAFALLTNYPDSRSNAVKAVIIIGQKTALTSEQLKLLAGYCAMNSNALALAQAAARRPRCRYPVKLSLGAAALFPHLAKLKQMSLLAEYQSAVDEKKSAKDIATIVNLARTLDAEPVLISKLVRIALLHIAVATLERRLNEGELTDQEMKQLGELFAESAKTNQMANALIGERATFMQYFETYWEMAKIPAYQKSFLRLSGIWIREQRFYLKTMTTYISHAGNYPKNLSKITNLDNTVGLAISHKRYLLLSMLMPAVGSVCISEAEGLAEVRTAQAGLAVERFRLKNGKLPRKLDDLVPQLLPALPKDPFDGQPLRYHRLEKGYVIYSIGSDGEDNGGRERPVNTNYGDKTNYDITFTVER